MCTSSHVARCRAREILNGCFEAFACLSIYGAQAMLLLEAQKREEEEQRALMEELQRERRELETLRAQQASAVYSSSSCSDFLLFVERIHWMSHNLANVLTISFTSAVMVTSHAGAGRAAAACRCDSKAEDGGGTSDRRSAPAVGRAASRAQDPGVLSTTQPIAQFTERRGGRWGG